MKPFINGGLFILLTPVSVIGWFYVIHYPFLSFKLKLSQNLHQFTGPLVNWDVLFPMLYIAIVLYIATGGMILKSWNISSSHHFYLYVNWPCRYHHGSTNMRIFFSILNNFQFCSNLYILCFIEYPRTTQDTYFWAFPVFISVWFM